MQKDEQQLQRALEQAQEVFKESEDHFNAEIDKYIDSLTEDQREMIVCYVFKKLEQHLKQGGSYRTMVYDIFDLPASYVTVQMSGGIDIHNCIIEKYYENKDK